MDFRSLVKRVFGHRLVSFIEDFLFFCKFGKVFCRKVTSNKVEIHFGNKISQIYCDDEQIISNFLSLHERKNIGVFLRYLDYYDCYVDIGANIGVYCVLAANIFKNKKPIIAFEPGVNAYTRCAGNLKENNISLFNFGISNVNQEFYVTQGLDGVALSIDENQNCGQKITCKKGDEVLGPLAFKSLFVKIDVEGHEGEVLDGLKKTLTELKNGMVYIEIHNGILKRNGKLGFFNYVLNQMEKNGYSKIRIDRSHILLVKK